MQLKAANLPAQVRGVTMVEILIAIIVFSAGLLGLLSAASLSIRTNAEAYQFTQVTNIADYVVASMQRNVHGTLNRNYDGPISSIDIAGSPNYVRECQAGSCTSVELANDDLNQVALLMGQYLPVGAQGAIRCGPQVDFPVVQAFISTLPPNTGDCVFSIQWAIDRNGTIASRSWSFQP